MFRTYALVLGLAVSLSANDVYGQSQRNAPQQSPTSSASGADKDQARAHAMAGFDALDAGKHEQAVQHFSAALDIIEAPTLRVGRGDALVSLNRWLEAIDDYQSATAYVPASTDRPAIAEAQQAAKGKLTTLKARLPVLVVRTQDSNAQVQVDEAAPQPARDGAPIPVNPGAHRVVLTSFGTPVVHDLQLGEGQRTELLAPPPSSPTPAPVTAIPADVAPTGESLSADAPRLPPPKPNTADNRVLIAGAASGALALGAIVTGVMWLNERAKLNEDRERDDDYHRSLGIANAGLWAGVLIGAGVTSYFWLTPQSESGPNAMANGTPTAAFVVSPNGILANLRGQF